MAQTMRFLEQTLPEQRKYEVFALNVSALFVITNSKVLMALSRA
jgi:hypothetical protein